MLTAFATVLMFAADPPPDVAALIRRLGSASFEQQVAAEQALTALGPAAYPALAAGTRHPDPELARRCTTLRNQMRAVETAAFLADGRQHSSPCWPRYRQIVGDTPDDRKLFAELLADPRRREALEAAERSPAWGAVAYAASITQNSALVLSLLRQSTGGPVGQPGQTYPVQDALRVTVPRAEIAGLFLLGARPLPTGAVDPTDADRVVSTAGFADGAEGPLKAPFRKLFVAWLDQRREPRTVQAGLRVALMCGVPEVAPAARRIVSDKPPVRSLIVQAMLVLGHHGGPADRALLAAWRTDEREVSTQKRPDGKSMGSLQMRDVAAGMSLKLAGENPEGYGFGTDTYLDWRLRSTEGPFVAIGVFGSDEKRNAALAKAWDWLDRHPAPRP